MSKFGLNIPHNDAKNMGGILVETLKSGSDVLFILLGAIMVLAMHAGFAFLELGTVRKKNQVNALVKILVDFAVSTIAYFFIGYSIAYGVDFFSGAEILEYQALIRRVPVADNVLDYAVKLVNKTRMNTPYTQEITKKYITWGAGPRASQYLIIGAKCHAALNGKFSPDIEDVKAVAKPILRHRLVKNYKAEAEGFTMDSIIESLL